LDKSFGWSKIGKIEYPLLPSKRGSFFLAVAGAGKLQDVNFSLVYTKKTFVVSWIKFNPKPN